MAKGNSLNSDIYGSDDLGAAGKIDLKLNVPTPTLDNNGETDSRAQSEGNHGKQP